MASRMRSFSSVAGPGRGGGTAAYHQAQTAGGTGTQPPTRLLTQGAVYAVTHGILVTAPTITSQRRGLLSPIKEPQLPRSTFPADIHQ